MTITNLVSTLEAVYTDTVKFTIHSFDDDTSNNYRVDLTFFRDDGNKHVIYSALQNVSKSNLVNITLTNNNTKEDFFQLGKSYELTIIFLKDPTAIPEYFVRYLNVTISIIYTYDNNESLVLTDVTNDSIHINQQYTLENLVENTTYRLVSRIKHNQTGSHKYVFHPQTFTTLQPETISNVQINLIPIQIENVVLNESTYPMSLNIESITSNFPENKYHLYYNIYRNGYLINQNSIYIGIFAQRDLENNNTNQLKITNLFLNTEYTLEIYVNKYLNFGSSLYTLSYPFQTPSVQILQVFFVSAATFSDYITAESFVFELNDFVLSNIIHNNKVFRISIDVFDSDRVYSQTFTLENNVSLDDFTPKSLVVSGLSWGTRYTSNLNFFYNDTILNTFSYSTQTLNFFIRDAYIRFLEINSNNIVYNLVSISLNNLSNREVLFDIEIKVSTTEYLLDRYRFTTSFNTFPVNYTRNYTSLIPNTEYTFSTHFLKKDSNYILKHITHQISTV